MKRLVPLAVILISLTLVGCGKQAETPSVNNQPLQQQEAPKKQQSCFANDGMYMSPQSDGSLMRFDKIMGEETKVLSCENERYGKDNTLVKVVIEGDDIFGKKVQNNISFRITDDCYMYTNSYDVDGEKRFDPTREIPPTGTGDYEAGKTYMDFEPIEISIKDVYNEYKNNELKANNDYNHKRVVFSSIIKKIQKDSNDNYFIELDIGQWDESKCHIRQEEETKLAEYNIGDQIKLNGWIAQYKYGILEITHCSIE